MSDDTLITGEQSQVAEGEQQGAADASATLADSNADQQQQQAQGEQPAAEGEQGEAAKPEGAPEKYEFKAPDGGTFDDAVLAEFSTVARELNLTQDQAQKVVDQMGAKLAARQSEIVDAQIAAWADASRSDKEFGGDKLDENLGIAKEAIKQFGSPELVALLNKSGLGNHPEVIRFALKVGNATREDSIVTGSGPQGARTADGMDARSLYPNSNMN